MVPSGEACDENGRSQDGESGGSLSYFAFLHGREYKLFGC